MVCRFIDGFDYYSADDITRKWTSESGGGSLITTSNQRTGAGAISFSASFAHMSRTLDDQSTWIIGFAWKSTANFSGQPLIVFYDNETIQCSLIINGDGTLEVVNGTGTAVANGKAVLALHGSRYAFIEMKVTISDSIVADSCVVRINEQIVITVDAGEDLQAGTNSTVNKIWISGGSGTVGVHADDLYMFDGTDGGGTDPINNDFAGDVKVATHWPNGNGATSDFTGSDADSTDNYLHLDEALTDDDSTYVESITPGQIDLHAFDDLATVPDGIRAVQINNVVRKTEAGSRTMRSVTRPASTNFFGTSKSLSFSEDVDAYVNEFDVYDEDPETNLAWTESGFNATQFGIETET